MAGTGTGPRQMFVVEYDEGRVAIDLTEVAHYEEQEERVNAAGQVAERGRTRVREVDVTLRSGAKVMFRLYPDDLERWRQSFDG